MSGDSDKDGLTTSIAVTALRAHNTNLALRRVDVRVPSGVDDGRAMQSQISYWVKRKITTTALHEFSM
jgi:hypothetical protein